MRFSYWKILILGFGSLGLSVVWVIYNSYIPLFLEDRFSLSPSFIGFFMTLDNIAALIILPILGAWSDRVTTPIGRRMPFIVVGVTISAIAILFVPVSFKLPFFATGTILLILGMSLWRTPVEALLADITPSRHRSMANGIRNLMGGIGGIVAAITGSMLYTKNQSYPFWMASGTVFLAGFAIVLLIREPAVFRSKEEKTSFTDTPRLRSDLMAIVRDSDKSALRLFTAHFFWITALSSIEAFFTLYGRNHLGFPGSYSARILGLFPLMMILFALPSGYLGGLFGRKPVILSGLFILTITLLSIWLLPIEVLTHSMFSLPMFGETPVIGVLLMVTGIAWMCVNVNSLPMIFDCTNQLHTGTYTGIAFLFVTGAAIAGPNIMGFAITMAGNDYSSIYVVSSLFTLTAILLMKGVNKGEARPS